MFDLGFSIEVVTEVVVVAAIIFGIRWWLKNKSYWYVVTPVLAILGHTFIFYTFLIVATVTGNIMSPIFGMGASTFYSTWSAILRLHSITTFFFMLIIAQSCIKTIPKV